MAIDRLLVLTWQISELPLWQNWRPQLSRTPAAAPAILQILLRRLDPRRRLAAFSSITCLRPGPYHVSNEAETVACQNMTMRGACFVPYRDVGAEREEFRGDEYPWKSILRRRRGQGWEGERRRRVCDDL
jgi:hypothetical protein